MKAKRPARPKPKKPRGRAPGVPGTPAQKAASRSAALKTGAYAKSGITLHDKRRAELDKLAPGTADVHEAFAAGIHAGDSSGVDELAVRGLTDLEMIRRGLAGDIRRDGTTLHESIISPVSGVEIGSRVRVHPGIEPLTKISDSLGFVSNARRLDPRSKGEGAKDEALTKMLARDNALRAIVASGRAALPPPEPEDVIDAQVVDTSATK